MIKIIEEGDPANMKEFKCYMCGCVFESNEYETKYFPDRYCKSHVNKCPCCGEDVCVDDYQ
jgi:hypothetical protein